MLVISNITISNFSLLQAFSWSGRYILPYILEIFPSKFTIEKIVLNKKTLLFDTAEINNQLQYKVDQHLRQLTVENFFKKVMKL